MVVLASIAGNAAGRRGRSAAEKRYQQTEEQFKGQVSMIHDKLQEYDRLYDIYNDYEGVNNIKTIGSRYLSPFL